MENINGEYQRPITKVEIGAKLVETAFKITGNILIAVATGEYPTEKHPEEKTKPRPVIIVQEAEKMENVRTELKNIESPIPQTTENQPASPVSQPVLIDNPQLG